LGWSSCIALEARVCFRVRGSRAALTTRVRAIIASPKLLNKKSDSTMRILVIG